MNLNTFHFFHLVDTWGAKQTQYQLLKSNTNKKTYGILISLNCLPQIWTGSKVSIFNVLKHILLSTSGFFFKTYMSRYRFSLFKDKWAIKFSLHFITVHLKKLHGKKSFIKLFHMIFLENVRVVDQGTVCNH